MKPRCSNRTISGTDENETYLRPQVYERVDDRLDWIIGRHEGGQRIVNPLSHLHEMKNLMRGEVKQNWNCRAGHNMLIIRVDGALAPCFPMYSATHDCGSVSDHRFDHKQLDEMKGVCTKRRLSTCNYIPGFCYNTRRVARWGMKQAMRGFKGVSGVFEPLSAIRLPLSGFILKGRFRAALFVSRDAGSGERAADRGLFGGVG